MREDVEQQGLRTSQLETDAELRLRKAGVHVATHDEWRQSSSDIGVLYIDVQVRPIKIVSEIFDRQENGLYSYSMKADVEQFVRLARDPSMKSMLAPTYVVTGGLGTVGAKNLQSLRGFINDMVDVFLNDYLAMNPK